MFCNVQNATPWIRHCHAETIKYIHTPITFTTKWTEGWERGCQSNTHTHTHTYSHTLCHSHPDTDIHTHTTLSPSHKHRHTHTHTPPRFNSHPDTHTHPDTHRLTQQINKRLLTRDLAGVSLRTESQLWFVPVTLLTLFNLGFGQSQVPATRSPHSEEGNRALCLEGWITPWGLWKGGGGYGGGLGDVLSPLPTTQLIFHGFSTIWFKCLLIDSVYFSGRDSLKDAMYFHGPDYSNG